jgi:hypothetical protein
MPDIVEAVTRKSQAEMDPEELRQWLLDRRQQLIRHKRFTRLYLYRQAQRGKQKISTDQQVPGSDRRPARTAGRCSSEYRPVDIVMTYRWVVDSSIVTHQTFYDCGGQYDE